MLEEFGHYEEDEQPAPESKPMPTEEGTFSLAQLSRELGISPKIARSRYRAYENDGVRTRYIFEDTKEERTRVTEVISPKKATK